MELILELSQHESGEIGRELDIEESMAREERRRNTEDCVFLLSMAVWGDEVLGEGVLGEYILELYCEECRPSITWTPCLIDVISFFSLMLAFDTTDVLPLSVSTLTSLDTISHALSLSEFRFWPDASHSSRTSSCQLQSQKGPVNQYYM